MEQTKEKKQIRGENPLGYKSIPKLLAGFAIPSIIAMVVSSLYNVVDQIFIGQKVGYLGNAATNVSFPLVTICMAVSLTIGIGTAARFSLYLGQGREKDAAKTVGNGICMMILFGALYGIILSVLYRPLLEAFGATENILPYAITYTRITAIGMPFVVIMNGMSHAARADGSPMYSMITMLLGAVINTILDPVFIFVLDMGVAGAAWATVIGQVASGIFAVLYVRRFKRIRLSKDCMRITLRQMGRTAMMGMSNGLTQVAITFVQVVLNRSLVHYGALSEFGPDIPLAASGVVMKVNAIILSVIIGLVQGMQPIIGFNYGAGKYKRVKSTYKTAILCELVITGIGFAVFQLFPEQVLSIFGSGEEKELYYRFAVMFMRIFLITMPFVGIHIISSNFFSAIGKPIKGTILSLTRQVFFFIPLTLILPVFFGINGLMFAAPVSDTLSFLTVMVFITHEMRQINVKVRARIKSGTET